MQAEILERLHALNLERSVADDSPEIGMLKTEERRGDHGLLP